MDGGGLHQHGSGQRILYALGSIYSIIAIGLIATPVAASAGFYDRVFMTLFVGGSGLALVAASRYLPHTAIRPDQFRVVSRWCLRMVAVMVVMVGLGWLAGSVEDPLAGFVVLPALASVAGVGMGYHDAHARTRAADAEERQRDAERYSRELERYETIVETVNDGIFVLDEDAHFTLVNDAYTEIVGYDRDTLLGSPASMVAADETDVDTMADEISHDLAAGTAQTRGYESTIETAAGERRELESTIAPLPEHEGAQHDKVVVVRDITERNERKHQLKQQNERLDRFASMLAHELRNPVTIGQIYSQQLGSDAPSDAVEYITEAFQRIENLIDVMLMITRGRNALSENEPINLACVAADAWDEIDTPTASFENDLTYTIEADPTYIRHLFRNLFENAVEHGGDDVTVTAGTLDNGFYVADDGTGIPPDKREAVFGSGYTTTEEHGGMGLGLTFVKEMADVYDWSCTATESASGGARFEFETTTTSPPPREDAPA